MSVLHKSKRTPKGLVFSRKESLTLSEHASITMQSENFKMITTNPCYHQRRLEALHINRTHATLNEDDGSLAITKSLFASC